ncbi:hypothetical protein B0H13DRAFT_1879330 [Mycena leptocephala]|nr:hypothetical protein B0H13DRAFT_1879330 [Mycena leptocephala]
MHSAETDVQKPKIATYRWSNGSTTRVSGSQQIPSPPKKSSEDGMADSLKGGEARPLLMRIPAQTTDTKTSTQLHDHGLARDENNSFMINFFTGRFAFPPTLLECVQEPLPADGTNSTSVIIDPETKPVDMAQKRTSICFGLAGSNGRGRTYAYDCINDNSMLNFRFLLSGKS